MPGLKFELEVDSAAHPELYEMLLAIENPLYRCERIRQLAATGLILERLRIAPEPAQPALPQRADALVVAASHLALVAPTQPPGPRAHEFPVLLEEIPESQLRRRADDQPPSAPQTPPAAPEPALAVSEAAHPPDAPVDTAPIVHMPGNRSRLMRMKNRGLFTNE
jgi:hypothetical protein